jgi:glycosyltransferase involved in cell wall biosynthesis
MPAVSVIMPVYNVERYVEPALDSVLAQTWRDFEVLVVDDGSTDRTPAMVAEYAARDARIRVLHKTNGGISTARNLALRSASGSLIALLDGDDTWDPQFLESQTAILEAHPEVDVVTANARNLGGQRDGEPARPWPDGRPHPDLLGMIADEEAVFIMCVFRRRVYEQIGEFDETLRTNEDYDYWLRAASAGFRFFRNPRPLGGYRRRSDSLSSSAVNMLQGILRVYAKLRPALVNLPLERAALESQVVRFESEQLRALARSAIAAGDMRAAEELLAALRQRRRGPGIAVAHLMARWTPGLLARAFQFRESLREAS